jgi:uncharacterized protein (TIGR03083 family)
MQQAHPDRLLAEIEASTAKLAGIVSEHDPGMHVPTCPDWTLRKLATHVGRVHRWAAEIVGTRATEAIPFAAAPDGVSPDDPVAQAAWLAAGAQRVTDAIRSAGTDPVWAFGAIVPATFWARRQAHETMVHRADAELAVGRDVELDPGLAADAIDEWLGIMAGPRSGRPDARATALPAGASLHVHASGPDGAAEWLVSHGDSGIAMRREHGEASVTLGGPADQVLLVLVRRLPSADAGVTVSGDAAVLTAWLAGTPF